MLRLSITKDKALVLGKPSFSEMDQDALQKEHYL